MRVMRPAMQGRRGRIKPLLALLTLLALLPGGLAASVTVEQEDSVVIIGSSGNETVPSAWNASAVHNASREVTDDEAQGQGPGSDLWAKIRHLRQKVRLKENDDLADNTVDTADDYANDPPAPEANQDPLPPAPEKKKVPIRPAPSWLNSTNKNTFRLPASGTRKTAAPLGVTAGPRTIRTTPATIPVTIATTTDSTEGTEMMDETNAPTTYRTPLTEAATGAPNMANKFRPDVFGWSLEAAQETLTELSSTDSALDSGDLGAQAEEVETETDPAIGSSSAWPNDLSDGSGGVKPNLDIVTKFLRIVESQASLFGKNCTAGTELNLGEGVVDKYAQERFRLEAEVAVNRANWLTRLWKYADRSVLDSEYLLHSSLLSIIEMDEDIFAAGNCYDVFQYKDYLLFCPFAYRLPDGPVLAKDLAVEYKYLGNDSEWFYVARKNAERVIRNMTSITKAFHTYTEKSDNDTAHTDRIEDEVLIVSYEDGKWSKPYFDCGGGNIWMMTYTVPFFGWANGSYFFKGTSGIDIDLRRVDIDQCPQRPGNTQLNIFAASDKCKVRTTKCTHIPGLGFRRGSYRCECKEGFYFPDKNSPVRYYNGTVIEEEYEKKFMGVESVYDEEGQYECLPCPEGCDVCEDDSPCIVTLNWVMRTTILILEIIVICCLPAVALFTWRYGHIKVVRAASPALLRLIILGAFFIYCTTLVAYFPPNIVTCSLRVWLREIGFSFAYGALMLKTWRISVIFRVRSAKAVKITDLDLIKRLGIIVAIFTTFLAIRTMVGPPHVIVARTADDLKAYICQTDWWDHVFTAMEMMVLVWGIRLCIVVRKAPSEFNESRFISMAIYNEFLLSIFLNVSMLFLQSPANPDLMYIIMFSHTQLTTTLLLVLIFGSKAYLVLRGRGKGDDTTTMAKPQAAKFLTKAKTNNSQHVTQSAGSSKILDIPGLSGISDPEIQAEIRRVISELEHVKEKTVRSGNSQFATRLMSMLQVARQAAGTAASTPAAITVAPEPNSAASISSILTCPVSGNLENGPTSNGNGGVSTGAGGTTVAFGGVGVGGGSGGSAGSGAELRHRKSQNKGSKCKSPKNSPDSGLGGLMFGSSGGPHVNNVLACMTDKIVCATFSADPTAVAEDEEAEAVEEEEEVEVKTSNQVSIMSLDRQSGAVKRLTPVASAAPVASLALAAAPLLSFNPSGMAILRNYSAPNSRRNSYKPESVSTPTSIQNVPLSFVGDYANYGALATAHNHPMASYTFEAAPSGKHVTSQQSVAGASVTSLRTPTTPTTDGTLSIMSGQLATAERSLSADDESSELPFSLPPPPSPSDRQVAGVFCDANKRWSYPLSPQVVQKSVAFNASEVPPSDDDNSLHNLSTTSNLERSPRRRDKRQVSGTIQVDCTVRSAQPAEDPPQATPARSRSRSRSRINTDDRERFTEEVTV